MFYDCMGRRMPTNGVGGLCSRLNLEREEILAGISGPHSLMNILYQYFYERDILQVRKNEWLVCADGESAARTFDEMPITFKTKEDAVAWVHDFNDGCKVHFVKDEEDYVLMCVTKDCQCEKAGHGMIYAASLLDEEAHMALVAQSAAGAAYRVSEAFWNNQPVAEYAERIIRFYYECIRTGNIERLHEINGAKDAIPPKD